MSEPYRWLTLSKGRKAKTNLKIVTHVVGFFLTSRPKDLKARPDQTSPLGELGAEPPIEQVPQDHPIWGLNQRDMLTKKLFQRKNSLLVTVSIFSWPSFSDLTLFPNWSAANDPAVRQVQLKSQPKHIEVEHVEHKEEVGDCVHVMAMEKGRDSSWHNAIFFFFQDHKGFALSLSVP